MKKALDIKEIKHTVRIYDDELIGYIDELYATGYFPSKNVIINRGIEYGIPFLYKDLFGKKIAIDGAVTAEGKSAVNETLLKEIKKINLNIDDVFVVLNIIEHLTTTLFNVEVAKMQGVDITEDELRSGLLATLPEDLQEVKNLVLERHTKKRN